MNLNAKFNFSVSQLIVELSVFRALCVRVSREATFLLPAAIIGNVVGGLLIEKLRLNCSQIIRVLIVFAALTTINGLILLMVEETGDFAGVTVPYNSR